MRVGRTKWMGSRGLSAYLGFGQLSKRYIGLNYINNSFIGLVVVVNISTNLKYSKCAVWTGHAVVRWAARIALPLHCGTKHLSRLI